MTHMLWVIINVIIDDSRNYYTQLETDLFHEINACKRRLQQRQNELQRQIMKAKVFIIPTTNPKPNWKNHNLPWNLFELNLNGSPWTWSYHFYFEIVQSKSFHDFCCVMIVTKIVTKSVALSFVSQHKQNWNCIVPF